MEPSIQKKTNYFYIDESGNISNDSNLFIHGCIKTDSPDTIQRALLNLKEEIEDSIYYEKFRKKFMKIGFHATENTFDMRADLYKLLPLMDYRAYFVIINKKTAYFDLLFKDKLEHEIFELSLRQLLSDRIMGNKGDKNIFIFEQIEISKKSLVRILEDFFAELDDSHDCEFKIVGKDEENLAVIDYLNFIFNNILSDNNTIPSMEINFGLVQPKIAIVKMLHNNVFLSRKKNKENKILLENVKREFGGQSG